MSETGFAEFMRSVDPEFPYANAAQWRKRDEITILMRIAGALGVDSWR